MNLRWNGVGLNLRLHVARVVTNCLSHAMAHGMVFRALTPKKSGNNVVKKYTTSIHSQQHMLTHSRQPQYCWV